MRSILFPLGLGAFVCAAVALLCAPATPPQNVVFDKVRECNHGALAEALRGDPKSIEWRDSLGYTLLHWAVAMDDDAAVRTLLDAGADPNARDDRGRTPLHLAAMSQMKHGDVMIKTLISRGACVDAADLHGVTPIGFARGIDRNDLAQALLAAGAAEPAKAIDHTDGRVASAEEDPAAKSEPSPDARPRRPRPFAARRAWARLNGVRPLPPALRGNG